MAALLLAAAFAAIFLAMPSRDGLRDRLLRAVVVFGVALFLVTESLSAFSLIRPVPLTVCWAAIIAAALLGAVKARHPFGITRESFHLDPVVLICVLSIAAILALTALTAAFSPPNSADAMAYHLPRVVYWED